MNKEIETKLELGRILVEAFEKEGIDPTKIASIDEAEFSEPENGMVKVNIWYTMKKEPKPKKE